MPLSILSENLPRNFFSPLAGAYQRAAARQPTDLYKTPHLNAALYLHPTTAMRPCTFTPPPPCGPASLPPLPLYGHRAPAPHSGHVLSPAHRHFSRRYAALSLLPLPQYFQRLKNDGRGAPEGRAPPVLIGRLLERIGFFCQSSPAFLCPRRAARPLFRRRTCSYFIANFFLCQLN